MINNLRCPKCKGHRLIVRDGIFLCNDCGENGTLQKLLKGQEQIDAEDTN